MGADPQLILLDEIKRASPTIPPPHQMQKLEFKEGEAYIVEDNEQLPYKLLGNLGHGHSGNVEKVKDINTGKVFARKIIRMRGGRAGKDKKKIFDNEIQIIRRLAGHHHVIRIFATYVSKFEVGLILYPVADEGDLERFLGSISHSTPDGGFPDISDIDKAKVEVLRRSFGCLASGLEFMHQQKIRHKDIKPRNILVHQGSVIYTDFGYSLGSTLDGHSTTTGRPDFLTRRYSAFEVLDFMPRNSRSDVFSLGCVFLDVLSVLTKGLNIDPDEHYCDQMSSIHAQMSDIGIPNSLGFLVNIVISMTLETPAERPAAAEVAGNIRGHPGFLCDQCKPHWRTEIPLRQAANIMKPADSKNAHPEPLPEVRMKQESDRKVEIDVLRDHSRDLERIYRVPQDPARVSFPVSDDLNSRYDLMKRPVPMKDRRLPHSEPPLQANLQNPEPELEKREIRTKRFRRHQSRSHSRRQFSSAEEEAEYRAIKEERRATRARERELADANSQISVESDQSHIRREERRRARARERKLEDATSEVSVGSKFSAGGRERYPRRPRLSFTNDERPKILERPVTRRIESDRPSVRVKVKKPRRKDIEVEEPLKGFWRGLKKIVS